MYVLIFSICPRFVLLPFRYHMRPLFVINVIRHTQGPFAGSLLQTESSCVFETYKDKITFRTANKRTTFIFYAFILYFF